MNSKPVEWIKYLRDNPTKKGKGVLHKVVNGREYMCCLGAYCAITPGVEEVSRSGMATTVVIYGVQGEVERPDGRMVFGSSSGFLPPSALDIGGFRTVDPGFTDSNGSWTSLSGLNDSGGTWAKIADMIEEHWEEL